MNDIINTCISIIAIMFTFFISTMIVYFASLVIFEG